jgi:hypothetical protein
MVPPYSNRISRVPSYFSYAHTFTFKLQGFHLLRLTFPSHSSKIQYWSRNRLFPFRSPLLRKSRLISFPAVTEMFQFSAFASHDLCIQSRMTRSLVPDFSIQISSDQSLLPAPRGFSQAATSFVASYCQGIHHVRLISWPYNPKPPPAFESQSILKCLSKSLKFMQCTSHFLQPNF